jgi:hypothetical protein
LALPEDHQGFTSGAPGEHTVRRIRMPMFGLVIMVAAIALATA